MRGCGREPPAPSASASLSGALMAPAVDGGVLDRRRDADMAGGMTDLAAHGPTDPVERMVWRLKCIGVLAADSSAEAVRKAILDAGMQLVQYGRGREIKCATYADRFEELFGEPLVPKRKRAKDKA